MDNRMPETDLTVGLSEEEAARKLKEFGPNKLKSSKRVSIFQRLFAQINSSLIYILIIASLISGFLGEIMDSMIIGIVVVINAIVGVIQESKAEDALEALKNMSTPKALVRREGKQQEISSEEVVVGDVIILDAGRYIPCDIKLVESVNLKVEEAVLTGESVPVDKNADFIEDGSMPIGDRKDLAFASTLVTNGRATGIAFATGMDTEIGKIATMLHTAKDEDTPLQKNLAQLGKYLGIAALTICVIIFMVGVFQGRGYLEMFMLAVSLAVAAIPEGMPAIVSIVLAIGVQRMIKQNVIIRKLPAVEALGSVNVICSDKTGTLTQNRMTVTKFFDGNKLSGLTEATAGSHVQQMLFKNILLCNDATHETGDPTEIALLVASEKFGLNKKEINRSYPRVAELPFDSTRKLMTTVHDNGSTVLSQTKGAIDGILPRCKYVETIDGPVLLDGPARKTVEEAAESMSIEALRVLGAAYKTADNLEGIDLESFEDEMTFIGLVGMIDPPREEVKEAIELTKNAGIRTVMITGDHKDTAFAIASELGIASDKMEVIEGKMLDHLSEEELLEKSEHLNVYARVSPKHKVRIVQALKARGYTVSMTGDGVNDAPSLKSADIGVAMGITGTDVAKGASDMVLTDDNFSSIVKAIEEGRTIYRNIKKSILFLLSCNLGEILALFTAILLGWPLVLRPIHILWINLVTDMFPALSLGVDPEESGVMKEKSRNQKETIFKDALPFLFLNGILIGAITLFAFMIGIYSSGQYTGSFISMFRGTISDSALIHGQTMAFIALSFAQLAHSLNFRSMNESIFTAGIFKNKYLIFSILLGIALQITIVSVGPIASIFSVQSLSLTNWMTILGLSILPIVVNEIIKLVMGRVKLS